MNTFSNAFFLSCIIGFAYFALIETRLHRVEAKDYENSLNKKFTTFAGELKKLLDHQNVISSAQTHILEKLSGLESNTVYLFICLFIIMLQRVLSILHRF